LNPVSVYFGSLIPVYTRL